MAETVYTFEGTPLTLVGGPDAAQAAGGFLFSSFTVPQLTNNPSVEFDLTVQGGMTGTAELNAVVTVTYPGDGSVKVEAELTLKAVTDVSFPSVGLNRFQVGLAGSVQIGSPPFVPAGENLSQSLTNVDMLANETRVLKTSFNVSNS